MQGACGADFSERLPFDEHLFHLLVALPRRLAKFDQFADARHGYENAGSEFDSPMYEEMERPPLRAIDSYLAPNLCGLSARFTVAVMAMLGFIISFGIKNNVSTAKTVRKALTGVIAMIVGEPLRPINSPSVRFRSRTTSI